MAVLLLQLLFSASLVFGSEAASSSVIGNANTTVIDHPRESLPKYSVSKVQTDRNPVVLLILLFWDGVSFKMTFVGMQAFVLEPRAAFICITASINHPTPL